MAATTTEYQQAVIDHLQDYSDLSHPKKAAFIERLLIHYALTDNLHPNPDDEFSDPAIGPNYEIVGDYRKSFEKYTGPSLRSSFRLTGSSRNGSVRERPI